ncbi:MAG: pantetheine-phosphate adenylyltransferase [Magnetococcales bacterium]|nr:pantetheine-phosphate adenylyltransferase [Magnetococcales bacterium]MBF0157718.1 pantetheine-phosphate adenylyltransferase [Magnetococcales bacterium]
MQRFAVYPGSFDPVTLGHMDIIRRGASLFDRLVVAVATNTGKRGLFTEEERVELLHRSVAGIPGVEVRRMSGLLVDFVRETRASVVIRGLRAVSDFEYEFQMAAMNRKLNPEMETLFLTSAESTSFISSHLVREIAGMGGDVTPFVPTNVVPELARRLAMIRSQG